MCALVRNDVVIWKSVASIKQRDKLEFEVDIVGRGLAPAGGTMLRICRKVMRIRSILPPAGVNPRPTPPIEQSGELAFRAPEKKLLFRRDAFT